MCFSVEADVVAGLVLVPIGVLSLREVRRAREVPFAALPLLFGAHQLMEAVVWVGTEGGVSPAVQHAAVVAYLAFALVVLPTLLPLAVLLLEPRAARARVAPFVGLGLIVSGVLASTMLTNTVGVTATPNALVYTVGLEYDLLWTGLYIVAVIGPSVLSGYPSIVALGVLNAVGLIAVALFVFYGFLSLWCVYAALTSTLVLVHMVRRRRLPDPHRLHAQPRLPTVDSRA